MVACCVIHCKYRVCYSRKFHWPETISDKQNLTLRKSLNPHCQQLQCFSSGTGIDVNGG